jgi:hypothetical protein
LSGPSLVRASASNSRFPLKEIPPPLLPLSRTTKLPGPPLLQKGKYDEKTRIAHPETKDKVIAPRKAQGRPAKRVKSEEIKPVRTFAMEKRKAK